MEQSTNILLAQMLASYAQDHPDHREVATDMIELAGYGEKAYSRHFYEPGHFTGSTWIVDPRQNSVLLTHHKFLNKWLQLGGHAEGETDIRLTAAREAAEESGLDTIVMQDSVIFNSVIFDIDIHRIPASGKRGEPTHLHYDVRFLATADSRLPLKVSDESHDLAWIALDELESLTSEESLLRMRRKTAGFIANSDGLINAAGSDTKRM